MKRILSFLQSAAFRTGILLLALAAAIFAVVKNWDAVGSAITRFPVWVMAVEILLAFVYVYFTMASWRVVLNDVGAKVPRAIARRIFFSSQVAKYLPGGVWNFVAAAEIGRDYQISRRRSVCALLVSIVISIVTGLGLAAVAVIYGASDEYAKLWWVIPLGLILLCPPVLNRLVNLGLRILKREPLESSLTWGATARAALWALVGWLIVGLQLWLMLINLDMPANISTFWLATGGYALGWVAGFLVFIVPAGVGVREAALGAVLSSAVGPGAVVVVVLLARVFTTVADIGFAVAASIAMRKSKPDGSQPV